jgi:succinate-semialdehyde dehydrogenase/glutarate-semialdehyde dehydrogenase
VAGSARFDVTDPATGLKLADVANLGPVDPQRHRRAENGLAGLARQDRPRSARPS